MARGDGRVDQFTPVQIAWQPWIDLRKRAAVARSSKTDTDFAMLGHRANFMNHDGKNEIGQVPFQPRRI
jgi:hypothetical protein